MGIIQTQRLGKENCQSLTWKVVHNLGQVRLLTAIDDLMKPAGDEVELVLKGV
jgi:hypothetical protein